jgi:hypothetical protein
MSAALRSFAPQTEQRWLYAPDIESMAVGTVRRVDCGSGELLQASAGAFHTYRTATAA